MSGYKSFDTVQAQLQIEYVGFVAEKVLMDTDNIKRKDLRKFQISFQKLMKFLLNSFEKQMC
jgi:hypothetical protein